jgi:hypothetical protein
MSHRHRAGAARIGLFALSFLVAAVGLAGTAAAVDTKVYTGVGCRAAELPPAPQPTFNAFGTAFNQNPLQPLRLLCPLVRDSKRIMEVKVRVTVPSHVQVGCTLRTLRDDGSAQQTASATHLPHFGNAAVVREIHLNGHNAPSTAIGAYALECTLPLPAGGQAPGIIMYRVIEAD